MRKPFFLPIIFLFALSVFAGEPKQVTAKDVTFKSGDDTVKAVLYTPAVKGKVPGIVVIHEWWGLNDWVKQQAQKLAEQGYAALAVDFYRGQVATDPDTAHQLMRGLPDDRALRDMKAAVAFLKSQPDVDAGRIGDIGWCMGGGLSGVLAENDPTLKASVINYGMLHTEKDTLSKIHAAVLGNFGADDKGIPPPDVQAYEKTMKSLVKDVDVKEYTGEGHGFMHKDSPATADAWKRILAFFAAKL